MYKWLYRRNPRRFQQLVVDDFVGEIPGKISAPALTVFNDEYAKIERLMFHHAYELHKRMVEHKKDSEYYMGMLMEMKIFLLYFKPMPRKQDTLEMKKEDSYFDKAILGVKEFMHKLSTPPKETEEKVI